MSGILDRSFGREAFGLDAAGYHAARPPYQELVWQTLRDRAGLAAGIHILEIGAGTGLATQPLLAHNPAWLTAIEPDARLAAFLTATTPDPRLEVITSPFEAAKLPASSFDLVASATAFHWLDAVPALQRISGLLRPGGAVALWWNVFGDAKRPDPFHDATTHLFAGYRSSVSDPPGKLPHALDLAARLADFAAAGFRADEPVLAEWTLALDPEGVRRLYATYSHINALPPAEREALLDALARVAATTFAGRVERNMTTAIYIARP